MGVPAGTGFFSASWCIVLGVEKEDDLLSLKSSKFTVFPSWSVVVNVGAFCPSSSLLMVLLGCMEPHIAWLL